MLVPKALLIVTVSILKVFSFKVFSPFVEDFNYLDLKERGGFLDSSNFTNNVAKEIAGNIDSCYGQLENRENFKECLCMIFTCIEFYCELPKVVRNASLECVEPLKQPFEWHQNSSLEYYLSDPDVLLIYDNFTKYDNIVHYEPIYLVLLHHYRKKLLVLYEYDENYLDELIVLYPQRIETKEEIQLITAWIIYINNFSSFFSFLILLLFFLLVPQLRANICGKCWIMFSFVSMFNYSIFPISFIFKNYREFLTNFCECYFNVYYFLEFSIYFWLTIICFETLSGIR
jgi:hypothetical protein